MCLSGELPVSEAEKKQHWHFKGLIADYTASTEQLL